MPMQVIVGDIPAVDSANYGYSYGIVDDVRIKVDVGEIDGSDNPWFNTLGRSGWERIRNDYMPWLGNVKIDSADIARIAGDGRLSYVVEHEFAHVFGFNETIWEGMHLMQNGQYIGTHGLYAYRLLTGNQSATFVPTTGGHLSEEVFGIELMTPTMTKPPGPLSIVTIGILEDMGYKVNYSAADPYSLPAGMMAGLQSGSASQGDAMHGGEANHEEVPVLHMANVDDWLFR